MKRTEDEVRDEARIILDFQPYPDGLCGVGQITTFNQLGFTGVIDKPDGWYLPNNTNDVAIVLEVKNSEIDINKEFCKNELFKNIDIVAQKYNKIVGILYNGNEVLVYQNKQLTDLKNQLFKKEYYLKLFNKDNIDKQLIFSLTEQINNNLHKNFGINNLYHRMIFTACALVAQRYNKDCLMINMDWSTMHQSILSTIKKSYAEAKKQNVKLDLIADQFTHIQCNFTENQKAINDFIGCINNISSSINSDYWNGEDVMAIFFNEFTRYKGKSEQGQVFTPDHITSLIYRISGTTYKDNVLDACCGSGAFLVKAMSYMISEVGGVNNTVEVNKIKNSKLFGIEFSKELYALACANMLIHKDGKTNLIQDDSRTENVGSWIKSSKITKVLMNPPYESAYGCLDIVKNVLNNVEDGAICAFVLPDNKFEKSKSKITQWLKTHSLLKIIKLPDIFAGMAGVATSVFVFKAFEPQNNKEIFACWIKDDGLEIVKNKGRLDIHNKWQDIENKWVEIIYKQAGDSTIQWLDSSKQLMYKQPDQQVEVKEGEFIKTTLKYVFFEKKNNFNDYDEVFQLFGAINVKNDNVIDVSNWKTFEIQKYFNLECSKYFNPNNYEPGIIPYVARTAFDNGVVKLVKTDETLYPSNCITIGAESAKAFYQAKPFITGNKLYRIYATEKSNMNKYIGLFLCALLNKEGEKYTYSNAWVSDRIKETKLILPAKNNEPDWEYMENYIKDIFLKIEKTNLLETNIETESNLEQITTNKKLKP